MEVEFWVWPAFAGVVVALLVVDLIGFGRGADRVPLRRAVIWSIGWTVLGFGFAGVLWAWQGSEPAGEYVAGLLIEKSLSIDNLFVFAVVFAYFGIPPSFQRRALFWGIVGAIVLRAVFVFAGAALLDVFHYTIYVFGAFLVLTGIRFARHRDVELDPGRNPVLRLIGRLVPMSSTLAGDRLVIREHGRRVATPMVGALAMIATFDVVFAVDSIPAIFAVTRETFVVYAANAFSLLGLAALYFVLVDMIERFRYLNLGLAAVLVFVGLKMTLSDVYEVPIPVSLAVIVAALGTAVAFSLVGTRREGRTVPHRGRHEGVESTAAGAD